MNCSNEVKRFEKSFRLHALRYTLYSEETSVKGAIGIHNRAVTALGKLSDKVVATPSLYRDLILELLQDSNPKVVLQACFLCLEANLYTDKAMDTLVSIARNTYGISMICTFDINGMIQRFKKRKIDAQTRNEVDAIAEKMKSDTADTEIWNIISNLSEIDLCGHDGRTALIHACIFNRNYLVKKMIENGADVNRQDSMKKTPLHCAVMIGNIEIVTMLLNHKAEINLQDNRGFTALDFAKGNFSELQQEKFEKLVNLLIIHGAKYGKEINNLTGDGMTPLKK